MGDKVSFVLYGEIEEHLAGLSEADCGRLFLAILQYVNRGTVAELTGAVKMAFSFIRAQLDRDREKWIAVSKKRSEAGAKGGINSGIARSERAMRNRAGEASASFASMHEANEAVNVPATDNINGSVTDDIYGSVTDVIRVRGTRADWGIASDNGAESKLQSFDKYGEIEAS